MISITYHCPASPHNISSTFASTSACTVMHLENLLPQTTSIMPCNKPGSPLFLLCLHGCIVFTFPLIQ